MRRVAAVLTTLLAAAILLLHVSLPHCVRGAELTMSATAAGVEVPQEPPEPTLVHAFDADQTTRSDTADRHNLIAGCGSASGQRATPIGRPSSGAAVSRHAPVTSVPDLSELQVYRC